MANRPKNSISKKIWADGFFYIRKSNYTKFKKENSPAVKVRSYIDNANELTTQVMIMGNIYMKDKVVFMTENEYDELLEVWNSLSVYPKNADDSIYSCMRFDNKELKKRYKSEDEVKELLFTRMMIRNSDNFQAYHCTHCDFIHIGKAKDSYKKKLWEYLTYFIDYIKFKRKIKKELT